MGTCVVLGNQTLGSAELLEAVRRRAEADRPVYLVVPASRVPGDAAQGLHSEHARWHGEHPDVSAARWRLQRALEHWREHGIEADGEVGARDPVRALRDALTRVDADEVIVSSFPSRVSRWLSRDVPRRVERTVGLPVVVVEQADTRRTVDSSG